MFPIVMLLCVKGKSPGDWLHVVSRLLSALLVKEDGIDPLLQPSVHITFSITGLKILL